MKMQKRKALLVALPLSLLLSGCQPSHIRDPESSPTVEQGTEQPSATDLYLSTEDNRNTTAGETTLDAFIQEVIPPEGTQGTETTVTGQETVKPEGMPETKPQAEPMETTEASDSLPESRETVEAPGSQSESMETAKTPEPLSESKGTVEASESQPNSRETTEAPEPPAPQTVQEPESPPPETEAEPEPLPPAAQSEQAPPNAAPEETTPAEPSPTTEPENTEAAAGQQPQQTDAPPAPEPQEAAAGFDTAKAEELLSLINAEREVKGIGRVTAKDSLTGKAMERIQNGNYNGSGVISCYGTGADSASAVIDSWKKDWPDGTWMTSAWQYAGVACYVDGSNYVWVAVFGAY